MKNSVKIVLLSGLMTAAALLYAQEYDDLYFTKKDRKEIVNSDLFNGDDTEVMDDPAAEAGKGTGNKYKRAVIDRPDGANGSDNPNYSIPEKDPEDRRNNEAINNYYLSSRFNDPDWRWRFGSPWRSGGFVYAFSPGWSSFRNPWYDPFYNNFWSDPWYGQRGGFYTYNPWRWNSYYDPFWCPPYSGGSYIGSSNLSVGRSLVVVHKEGEGGRRAVVRGPRNTRGKAVLSTNGSKRTLRRTNTLANRNETDVQRTIIPSK